MISTDTNFEGAKKFASYGLKEKQKNKRESASGGGSSIKSTEVSRDYIVKVIEKYKISSILDLGCGDWNWMSKIRNEFENSSYEGWDANEDMIFNLNNIYGNDNTKFYFKDIVTGEYPKVDMVLCRDVLFHLKEKYTLKIIEKIKKSKIKYFLTTSFNDVKGKQVKFRDRPSMGDWGFYEINLNLPPFNLEKYLIDSICEHTIKPNSGYKRYLNLYRICED